MREVAECPLDAASLAPHAAGRGQLECLQYIHQHYDPFTADQLTEQLCMAGHQGRLATAQWLHAQGAGWPDLDQHPWSRNMTAWANSAGYTATREGSA